MFAQASIPHPIAVVGLLDGLSGLSTLVIVGLFAAHVFGFLVLWIWWRRDLRAIASSLDEFTRGLRQRSLMDGSAHLSEQVDAFLADVGEVLEGNGNSQDRHLLYHRMAILDEKRRYLSSMFFETSYNICRTMIEAYPLLGVLGTILAIGAALQTGDGADASASVGIIVSRFGDAIWSTFAGLTAAVLLMFLNSVLEPRFQRLAENRANVRTTVAHAKRELAIGSSNSLPGSPQ
ncbi:MAG: MotA/TolQ/ExbB proton channel family protein [Planctomycetota bacterium]|nr:MotA/TolQ/ExbB proton channel family protein [Planctomycetota bacterium]MDA1162426.1 MotA/TolQ/ExbB proton channel family protein [Planctomycetota bacterium]